jgi:uncharacterized integral membrane protein (TIGR00697 family)
MVSLVAIYIALQLIADVTVAKIVTIFGITIPAGSLLYAVTFTWRDFMHKRLGRSFARAAIVLAAVCNIGMAIWFMMTIWMPPASFWTNQEAYASVLGIIPRITAASIITEVFAEWLDTEVYHWARPRFTGKWQGARILVSNAVSAPFDAIVFGILAFAGTMPLEALMSIVVGGIIFKLVIGYVLIPVTYVIPDSHLTMDLGEGATIQPLPA